MTVQRWRNGWGWVGWCILWYGALPIYGTDIPSEEDSPESDPTTTPTTTTPTPSTAIPNDYAWFNPFFSQLFDKPDPSEDPFDRLAGSHESEDSDLFRKLASLFRSTPSLNMFPNDNSNSNYDKAHDESQKFVTQIVNTFSSPGQAQTRQQIFKLFQQSIIAMQEQMQKTFGDMQNELWERFNLLQLTYFLQHEESVKNPVWKRRQHRFMTPLPVSEAVQLGDGLFLSHLAYVDDCHLIQEYLRSFHNGAFVLRNRTTSSQPNQPAHFLAVRKIASPSQTTTKSFLTPEWKWLIHQYLPFFFRPEPLEVVLTIRGTKEIGDFLSDAMLAAAKHRNGKAHDGILKSTQWMLKTYTDDLQQLLKYSQRDRMNLWLVGHSLGGGTAA